ncbi:MAG: formimidoylglutamase [Balneolaceae bacterium]|nr:formimidoylglutamase [Balneolaceae bacterium]
MEKLKASQVSLSKTDKEDPRIGQIVTMGNKPSGSCRAVLIGFPCDEGVKRNGGRPGAAKAPDEIRKELYKMTPDAENPEVFTTLLEQTYDAGNFEVGGDLEEDQKAFGEVVSRFLKEGIIPIILGGGHETAFAHFSGYAQAGIDTAILNIDAHTDVRPLKAGKPHSGSPFRQAIEHHTGCCSTYLVAGLQPHSVSKAHLEFIDSHGGSYLFRDETNITSISGLFHNHESKKLMVTFDMDAVDQSQAPGVSAPCANGLPADLWLMAAYLAGKDEKVASFDISEVNPLFDRDGQTSKLAALTVWNFLLGLSQR